jgi:PilZ domain
MNDKRRSTRAPLDIYLNKYVGGVPYLARAADISPEGVRLARLIEPEHRGRRVGLQFQLPGSEEVIYAEGEVVREWVQGPRAEGSSIRFTLLTERHRRMIQSYVSERQAA